jgi:hypothetical protein
MFQYNLIVFRFLTISANFLLLVLVFKTSKHETSDYFRTSK